MPEFELICCIVNHLKGSKVLKEAKINGVKGGTVYIGKGTAQSRILELLDLNDSRKEIVWMIAEKDIAETAMEKILNKFGLEKKGSGIAFRMPLASFFGTGKSEYNITANEMGKNAMYNAIFTIVDKGNSEEVVEAAKAAGARGATIWNARGSGVHETEVLFSMPVEPEREIVMIIAKTEIIENIMSQVRSKLKIDEPGNGIIFSSPINEIYGLM